MANYIAKSDIESVFGADNVAAWSNLDNTDAGANEDRIDAAIAYAEAVIDDRFRTSRYAVPLQGDGATLYVVKDWAAKLAGIWLYESRGLRDANDEGNKLRDMLRAVHADISAYLAGQRRLRATPAEADAPTAPVVIE